MTSPYVSVTVSGYNASPPSDDGTQVAANQLNWSKHKLKIGDPLKTAIEAINANAVVAFDLVGVLNATNTWTANQTITKAAAPTLIINETGGTTEAVVAYQDGGSHRGYAGVQVAANRLILSTPIDYHCFTSTAGFGWSADNGVTPHLLMSSSGVVTTPNASAGEVGTKGLLINSQTGASYTLLLTDAGKTIDMAIGTGSQTLTIPTNASVPLPPGTVIRIWGNATAGVTINISGSDILYLAGTGFATTGSRTLAYGGVATLEKRNNGTSWLISGIGLT